MFPTQNVSEQNQKHFLCPGRKICVRNKCCARGQTFVSATMRRQQCVLVCQGLKDLLQCYGLIFFQIGCLVSSLYMLAFRASESALWMGTSTFGLFMSNVFPTSVALAEQYFNVTGLSNSCLAGRGEGTQ